MEVRLFDVQTQQVFVCQPGVPLQAGRPDGAWCPDVPCRDKHVSRRHCLIEATADGRLQIQDQSTYGTFVGDAQVRGVALAAPGHSIRLGHGYTLRVLPPPGSPDLPPSPPGYRLEGKRYARRGFTTYAGFDEARSEPCAVEILSPYAAGEREHRIENEGFVARALSGCPFVLTSYDAGHYQGRGLYVVTQQVEGTLLTAELAGRLGPRGAASVVAQVARGLAFAHGRGIAHRRLDPTCVLVAPSGAVRLLDLAAGNPLRAAAEAARLPPPAPNYFAPEVIEDSKREGFTANIYSVGAILYMGLTGAPPFARRSTGATVRAIQTEALAPPRQAAPGLDPRLEEICLRAMSKAPAARHPSAEALAQELEAWVQTQGRA